jgi:hypothetical protein
MKKNILNLTIMLAGLMMLAVSAFAQSHVHTVRMKIDFGFNAGSQYLPAGEYEIGYLRNDSSRKVVQIRSADGRHQALVHSMPSIETGKFHIGSEIVFHQYGDQRFLSLVQFGDSNFRAKLIRSKQERNAAENFQQGNVRVVTLKISNEKTRGVVTGL